jgi:hypothetical protein
VLVAIATSLARSLAPANGAGQLRITALETGLVARAWVIALPLINVVLAVAAHVVAAARQADNPWNLVS